MRPAGEISQALIKAARELRTSAGGATLQEMADRACVGRQAARDLVPKLKSRGHLEIVGERLVAYRNRPVKEYAPASTSSGAAVYHGHLELVACMSRWGG